MNDFKPINQADLALARLSKEGKVQILDCKEDIEAEKQISESIEDAKKEFRQMAQLAAASASRVLLK